MSFSFLDPRLPERFWSRVAPCPMSGCWLWTAQINKSGYGVCSTGNRQRPHALAHRYAFQQLVGPMPEGLQADHLCRVRSCVNPTHIEPVTARENSMRGMGVAAVHAAKVTCVRGHRLDGDQVRVDTKSNGTTKERVCRECSNERNRAYRARKSKAARCPS